MAGLSSLKYKVCVRIQRIGAVGLGDLKHFLGHYLGLYFDVALSIYQCNIYGFVLLFCSASVSEVNVL